MRTFTISIISLCVILSGHLTSNAQTPITSCGVISAPGSYAIEINSAAAGDCLTVGAPNVTLACPGPWSLQGNETGTGLHILPSATGFILNGANCLINNFAIAMEDDAAGTTLQPGSQMIATQTAILLNGATSANINVTLAEANTAGGNVAVMIQGGGNNKVSGQLIGMGTGVIIAGSGGNVIYNSDIEGGLEGVFVSGPSQHNAVYNNTVNGFNEGIRLGKATSNNFVSNNTVIAGTDLFQGTVGPSTSCNGNFWINNVNGIDGTTTPTFNQACTIQ